MWSIGASPEVKLLGWKICYEILATKLNMRKKVVIREVSYPRCSIEIEDNIRLLFKDAVGLEVVKCDYKRYCEGGKGV